MIGVLVAGLGKVLQDDARFATTFPPKSFEGGRAEKPPHQLGMARSSDGITATYTDPYQLL